MSALKSVEMKSRLRVFDVISSSHLIPSLCNALLLVRRCAFTHLCSLPTLEFPRQQPKSLELLEDKHQKHQCGRSEINTKWKFMKGRGTAASLVLVWFVSIERYIGKSAVFP